MARDEGLEAQRLELADGLDPVAGIAEEAERQRRNDDVAGGHDLLLRQPGDQVAVGVGPAKMHQPDRDIRVVEHQLPLERLGRRDDIGSLIVGENLLKIGQRLLDPFAPVGSGRRVVEQLLQALPGLRDLLLQLGLQLGSGRNPTSPASGPSIPASVADVAMIRTFGNASRIADTPCG